MKRVRKATQYERSEYALTRPVYPLFGFIRLLNGTRLAVEDLAGDPDLKYEVMAPAGYHFEGDRTHSLLAVNQSDAADRVEYMRLVVCTDECECGGYKPGYDVVTIVNSKDTQS